MKNKKANVLKFILSIGGLFLLMPSLSHAQKAAAHKFKASTNQNGAASYKDAGCSLVTSTDTAGGKVLATTPGRLFYVDLSSVAATSMFTVYNSSDGASLTQTEEMFQVMGDPLPDTISNPELSLPYPARFAEGLTVYFTEGGGGGRPEQASVCFVTDDETND